MMRLQQTNSFAPACATSRPSRRIVVCAKAQHEQHSLSRRAAAGVLLGLPTLFAAPSAFADLLTGIPGDPEPEKFKKGDSPAKERRAALDKTAAEIKASGKDKDAFEESERAVGGEHFPTVDNDARSKEQP